MTFVMYQRDYMMPLREQVVRVLSSTERLKHSMTAKVLVVGNGPSKTNYEFINNFDGTVLCVDMVGKEIMEHGRVPDYVLFSEINEGVIKYTDQTLPKEYIGKDITIIHLSSMKKTVIKMMDDMGLKHETFLPQYTTSHQATGNVGLYSVAY